MSLKAPPRPEVSEMMKKFPGTWQIVMMLKHFEGKHNFTQQALIDSGEGCRVTPWKINKLGVEDLMDYIYKEEGLKL